MRNKFLKAARYVKPRPTYVSTGAESSAGSGSVVISKPSGLLQGDLMIAFMGVDTSAPFTVPTGWTLAAEYTSRPGTAVMYKTATSSEPATYTFSATTGSNLLSGCIVVYRGAAYDVAGSFASTAGSTLVTTAVTASASNSVLLAVYCASATGSATFTAPTGMTNRYSDAANRPPFVVYDQDISAGSTGTRTLGTNANTVGVLLTIKPA
jgi:hypothetical protein